MTWSALHTITLKIIVYHKKKITQELRNQFPPYRSFLVKEGIRLAIKNWKCLRVGSLLSRTCFFFIPADMSAPFAVEGCFRWQACPAQERRLTYASMIEISMVVWLRSNLLA